MDRVQRSGLIALAILLLTAIGAHLIGSRPGSDAKVPPRLAAQDPAALEGVKFLPPEQRKFFVGPEDFVRPPVRNPLLDQTGRDIHGQAQPASGDRAGEFKKAVVIDLDRSDSSAAVQGSSPKAVGRKVRALENDTLSKIAARELGSAKRWPEIARLNGLKKPYKIKLGELLLLPESIGSGATETNISIAPGPGGERFYRVRENETASQISLKFFGTSKHWELILEANGISKPEKLRAGTTLRIPSLE
jgi:LysM repeat protein